MSASGFVAAWIGQLGRISRGASRPSRSPARALDVAMGRGRHALVLARNGFQTFGVDIKHDAVREAVDAAARDGLTIHGWCADLTMFPLPRNAFDLLVVTRYLQRDLFSSLRGAMRPGGCVIYETFTVNQRELGVGPTSPDHLLALGELRELFRGWEILFFEEVEAPEAVARIVARTPTGSSRPSGAP